LGIDEDDFAWDQFPVKEIYRRNWFEGLSIENPLSLSDAVANAEELVKALKLHWDHNHIKSIVITQINPNLNGFSDSFKHRIGKRVVVIGKLTKSEGYDLIKLRIQDKNPFDKSAIEAILENSGYIPRKILENCELVCAKTAGKKLSLNAFDVEKALLVQKILNTETPPPLLSKPILKQSPEPVLEKPTETPPEIPLPPSKASPLKPKLSPMEKKILDQLSDSEKTTQELSSTLETSEGSVGKQLSKLMRKNLVKITKQDRPKKYSLTN